MKIKFIVKEGNSCCWHRLYIPLDNMPFTEEDHVDMGVYGKTEDPGDCHLYLFNRDIAMQPEALDKLRKERGFKIVVDVDDYWELPFNHYLQGTGYDKLIPNMLKFMRMADLVTTTNNNLRDMILPLNKNVLVYPNTMVFGTPYTKNEDPLMRFSYIAGVSHLPDVNLLRYPFQKIGGTPDIRDRAVFNLSGFDAKNYSPTWNSMASVFGLTRHFRIYGSLYVTDYMDHYNNTDVSLIPLVANRFNECKSHLKVVEAAARKISCIVSDVMPYKALQDAPGLMWIRKTSDWVDYIRLCLNNPEKVKEKGEMLHDYMKEHFNAKDWGTKRYQDLKTLT